MFLSTFFVLSNNPMGDIFLVNKTKIVEIEIFLKKSETKHSINSFTSICFGRWKQHSHFEVFD